MLPLNDSDIFSIRSKDISSIGGQALRRHLNKNILWSSLFYRLPIICYIVQVVLDPS